MLFVQDFLKNKTFRQLEDEHGVSASFSKCRTKFSLNYSQVSSNTEDVLANECRGLILSAKNGKSIPYDYMDTIVGETVIQAMPFKRFLNFGQNGAAEINTSAQSFRVEEKIDGSLTILYFDVFQKVWHVATRSSPEADIKNGDYTFRELFEKAINNIFSLDLSHFVSRLDPNLTYMFELTSPFNQVVVAHQDTTLSLIGVRDRSTLLEIDPETITLGVPKSKKYSFSDISSIINFVNSRDPKLYEGVVLCDLSTFNRVKIKNPEYSKLNRIVDLVAKSNRKCVEILLSGKDDDIDPFLPKELKNKLENIKFQLSNWMKFQDNEYYNHIISNPKSKKDFALSIKNNKIWKDYFFSRFDGKVQNIEEFIAKKSLGNDEWPNLILDRILEGTKLQNDERE